MNIIEAMQELLKEYPKINSLHIDYNENAPDSYGLYPTGDRLVIEDILGNQKRQHTFILYADFLSFNDYDRLSNSGALLELQQWLEQRSGSRAVTAEIDGEEHEGIIEKITCANGMLFNIPGENMNSAVRYQLQITAEYNIEL